MVVVASIPSFAVRRPGRSRRTFAGLAVGLGVVSAFGCGSDEPPGQPSAPTVLVDLPALFPDLDAGDVIALRAPTADTTAIEWIERRTGRIQRLDLAEFTDARNAPIETVAMIDVGTDGEQRGLLGQTEIEGVRYVAFTEPEANHLVVAALDGNGAVERIVWDAGGTAGGAVGGHLEAVTGQLVLGIGQLTDWAKSNGSGAMVRLDPTGPADQQPVILTDGYTNPFAFVPDGDRVWVADNAVGDDVEHIGRADLADRSEHPTTGVDPRAPSAMVALRDGRLGVCGFLDGQLLAWSTGESPGYGESLGPCLTGAAALPDGSIVTATDTAIILLPAPPS